MRAFRRMLINDPMTVIMPLVIFAVTLALAYFVRRLILDALRRWNARSHSRPGRSWQ